MSKGIVYTARGEELNFDNLVEQSKRPLNLKEEKSEVKRTQTSVRKPLNVRGNTPAAPTVTQPDHAKTLETKTEKKERRFPVKEDNRTLADYTSVRVDKPTYYDPKKVKESGATPEDASSEVVGNILNQLESGHPSAVKESQRLEQAKTKRKSRKSSKSDETEEDVTEVED